MDDDYPYIDCPCGWITRCDFGSPVCYNCGKPKPKPNGPILAAEKSQGKKFDQGKAPWHLLPWGAVAVIVSVLDFGCRKYGPRNWENGMDYSRLFSAAQRHLTAWFNGEDGDQETGLSHLAHAGCCILFLLTFTITGKGTDDRPNGAE